jgi:serine/threonine-protein kinase
VSDGSPRYRLDSRIATGGMGEVWRATDQVLGREVAVKLLKAEYADDATFRSRFETEARNAAALHHPHVASVFDFGELPADDDGVPQPYLVMELVRGQPLSALLRGGERMPPDTAADLIGQAADGIAAAHALGIVHRDVKPANLLVTPDGSVKITDFGIARAADAVALTQTGQVVGTPQYLSPEQAEGKPATGASDIYSLGVVLYECLAGRRPFDGDSAVATALSHLRDEPPPLPDDVPEHLRETVRVALAKDPSARFASVEDFATALHGGPLLPGTASGTATDGDAPTRVAGGAAVAGAGLAGAAAGAAGAGAGPAAAAEGAPADGTRVLGSGPGDPGRAGAGGPGSPTTRTRTTGPGRSPDDRRRRGLPAWVPWAAAAAAVLALLFLVSRLADNAGDGQAAPDTSTSTSADPTPSRSSAPSAAASPSRAPATSGAPATSKAPTTSKSPETVRVDPGAYVGRPEEDARQDLKALGLEVDSTDVDNPDGAPAGTVASVSPSGEVPVGSTVTLSVFGDPPVVETPSVPVPATPSVTAGDGKGKGNGGTKGKGKR